MRRASGLPGRPWQPFDNTPYGGGYSVLRRRGRRDGWKPKIWEMAKMKRPKDRKEGNAGGTPAKGDLFATAPGLWEFLTADSYDDGEVRQRATLLLFADGPVAKVCLSDRATSRIAFATGETFEEAVHELEEQIQADKVYWRDNNGQRQRKESGKRG